MTVDLPVILARLRSDKLRRQPTRVARYWLYRQRRDVRREWKAVDERARALRLVLDELQVAISARAEEVED